MAGTHRGYCSCGWRTADLASETEVRGQINAHKEHCGGTTGISSLRW